MKKVGLVCHFYVHYRIPVLKALASSRDIFYSFLGDTESSDDIKRVDFSKEESLKDRFIPVKNMWIGHYLVWQKGVIKKLNKENFDAVIFLGDIRFLSTWMALIIMRIKGKKSYLWSHGLYGKESWLHLQIKLLFFKLAHGIFLYSNKARNLSIQHGVHKDKLIVIYNSLNFDETEQYRKGFKEEFKIKIASVFKHSSLPILFCIGRINKTKKIHMLIEAISILKERQININCFIIGEGSEKKHLEDLVEKLNLKDHLNFVGELYDEKEISQYILSADACVCPGPVGLTGMHSLSYGVPVISNDNFSTQMPEHEAIIPGVNGAFFKDGDVCDLANKIEECISQRLEDRDGSIQNCLSVIQQYYNPEFQKKTINNHILSALNKH